MTKDKRSYIESQLKSCPFCGATAKFESDSRAFVGAKSTRVSFVRCSRCSARTGKFDVRSDEFTPAQARQMAIDAWNCRV